MSDRARGTLIGLAIGDALGAAVEFRPLGSFRPVTGYRDGGPHGLAPGEWTDDTSMALALADSIASAGWDLNDHDKIAAATVAGHILECGTQSTGGNFDGWRDVPDMAHIGYPICEAYPDGSFVITKQEGTGGLVSTDTVTAQLLYELGDPHSYLTPDVTADFSTIELESDGPNRVRVHGIKGRAATPTYKVSMSYSDGYKILGDLTVARIDEHRYLMFGSGSAEVFYLRWFERHRPASGVEIRNMTAALTGFSISGPRSRDLLAAVTGEDVSDAAFRFLAVRRLPIGHVEAKVFEKVMRST